MNILGVAKIAGASMVAVGTVLTGIGKTADAIEAYNDMKKTLPENDVEVPEQESTEE